MAKGKKHDTFIDMTAMSDVTVLLLTFFMLTATFLPKEPVQVNTPPSVMETKVPEYNVMNILVDPEGKVYLNIDRPDVRLAALDKMTAEYGVNPLNAKQKKAFVDQPYIGTPINRLAGLMDLPMSEQDQAMKQFGIPIDSANNQLARWVQHVRAIDEDMRITLKADQSTDYPKVNKVMKILVDIKANRYSLITVLKGMPEGF